MVVPLSHGRQRTLRRIDAMKKLLMLSALAAVLSMAVTADANAWTRNRTVSGAAGTASLSVTGSCANGACNRQAVRTGPYGRTFTHQGTAACNSATQSCSGSATTTLPNGNIIYRQSSVQY
jgi:hypothetical protein